METVAVPHGGGQKSFPCGRAEDKEVRNGRGHAEKVSRAEDDIDTAPQSCERGTYKANGSACPPPVNTSELPRGSITEGAGGPSSPKQSNQPKEQGGGELLSTIPISYPPPMAFPPTWELQAFEKVEGEAKLGERDYQLLHKAHHHSPFSVLGCHLITLPDNEASLVVRAWVANAHDVRIQADTTSGFVLLPEESEAKNDAQCPSIYLHRHGDWLFERHFRLRRYVAPLRTSSALPQDASSKPNSREKVLQSEFEASACTRLRYSLLVRYSETPPAEVVTKHCSFSFPQLLLPQFDLKLFQSGSCWHVDNLFGSHMVTLDGVRGCRFGVWAPSARFVSVVGDFNQWDGRTHPMRRRHEFGVWEIFISDAQPGQKYAYNIYTQHNTNIVKIDPYAQEFENPPQHASIISPCDDAYKRGRDSLNNDKIHNGEKDEVFQWEDQEWLKQRMEMGKMDVVRRQPMSIYECHLPSWMRGANGEYLGYRDLAHRLLEHLKRLNFTHVEFLPLAWHPFEGSWGYQTVGLYAPYSRLGNGDDLKYLINELHKAEIGVFLDFVPGHFVKDDWGLIEYDGSCVYEYSDPREGEHKEWGTKVFNFRRNEVRSFLLGAAYHWLRRYHVDGLRIDAVSSMLYRNHMRPAGQWIPNEYGGDANLEAVSFLQELNWVIRTHAPGVFTMAEESTSWQGVTDRDKGLGFDAKWDLGWMNDTLSYLCTPFTQRCAKHNKLTFRGLYMAHEKWVLPLSHDEVVSGKGSLLDKCGFQGTPFEERIKGLRALFGFQVGSPGRPLLFQGAEFGQGREWKESRSVDWHESCEDARGKVMLWLSDLLGVYRWHKALHAGDDESWNFQWVDCENANDNVIAFLRKFGEWFNDILVICNFSGCTYKHYPVGVPHGGQWKVLLNSDDWRYGGSMQGLGNNALVETTQGGRLGWPYCLWLDIPAHGCLFIQAPQPPPPPAISSLKEASKSAPPAPGSNEDLYRQ